MTIVQAPETIDTVVTENTFGDILSDIAAAVTGGLGLAASASLGDDGPGIFEPVHGSAPQIAGQGIANPAAMLRSVALMLSHGLGRADEASALERAVDAALVEAPTPDLGGTVLRRATSATPSCARWTLPVPCDDDATCAGHYSSFRGCAPLSASPLRASRRLRPAPRRLAEFRRIDSSERRSSPWLPTNSPSPTPAAKAPIRRPRATGSSPPPGSSPCRRSPTSSPPSPSGRVPYGVLPIESSLVGPVAETHDLLYESPLSIVAEAILPVNHCLVGPAAIALADVREVHSHPVALDQCRKLLASLPHAIAVAAPTTGDAASIVAKLGDPAIVAIASDRAARINGLTIIDGNVGDHPEAYTRFVSIAPYTRLDRRDGQWRTAFSFTTDHRPGALLHALEPLARHGIDLNLLVSRPIPSTAVQLPLRRRPQRASARPRDLGDPAGDA